MQPLYLSGLQLSLSESRNIVEELWPLDVVGWKSIISSSHPGWVFLRLEFGKASLFEYLERAKTKFVEVEIYEECNNPSFAWSLVKHHSLSIYKE